MSTKTDIDLIGSAGGSRSEPGGRAKRPGGAAGRLKVELPSEIRDRLADEVIDELLAGARTEEEIVGPGGVRAQLTKRLVERAMSAELTEHLGYQPHQEPPGGSGNTRCTSRSRSISLVAGSTRSSSPTPAATPKTGPTGSSPPRSPTQPSRADPGGRSQLTISDPYRLVNERRSRAS